MKLTELHDEIRIRNNNLAKTIEHFVDQETGEVSEEALEILQKEEKNRIALLTNIFDGITGYGTLADAVKMKLDRLKRLEKYYRNTETSLKKMVGKLVPEGENINTEDFAITWRKSNFVDIDDFVNLVDIESKYPEAIKTEKSYNKMVLKKLLKEGAKIEGVELRTKQNIQIK